MAAIIESAAESHDSFGDWLEEGMRTALARFSENHALFVKHFPLDPKREELYARTPVDEDTATGATLSKPFEDVATATADANKAGLTTDDFLRIVDKMAEFARIVSTIPPKSAPTAAPPPSVAPEDRITVGGPVSSKKRILLSGFGFFERVYNLLASSAQLASPPEGNVLLSTLRGAISALSKVIIGR